MQYRMDKYGNPLSILGFGCMRFPQKGGHIDMEATEKQLLQAIDGGVNYFDTAFVYGNSEAVVGEILEKNSLRDRINIATKLPHYLVRKSLDFDKIFLEELRRLRTDHVDYYLMHMLTDTAVWDRLRSLGVESWLHEKQESGQIRQVGFSYHGNSEMFTRLVDVRDWDFVQIQYNYMDENSQAGRRGLNYAHGKGLPVIIMEPLRGGKLAKLPSEARQIMSDYHKKCPPASWAFRWLWSQPEVTVVLSGMNSERMIDQNIRTADTARVGQLTEEDNGMLRRAANAISAKMKVGCTGCGYCQPCPQNVDIPGAFAAYNHRFTEGKMVALKEYVMCTAMRKDSSAASNCIGCGACEKRCPQHLSIREELQNVRQELEGFPYKAARFGITHVNLF